MYSEDFSTQADAPLDSSREQVHYSGAITDTWTISGGWATTTGANRENSILLRPSSESFRDGKLQFVGKSERAISPWFRVTGTTANASGYVIWIGNVGDYVYNYSVNSVPIPDTS